MRKCQLTSAKHLEFLWLTNSNQIVSLVRVYVSLGCWYNNVIMQVVRLTYVCRTFGIEFNYLSLVQRRHWYLFHNSNCWTIPCAPIHVSLIHLWEIVIFHDNYYLGVTNTFLIFHHLSEFSLITPPGMQENLVNNVNLVT